MTSWSAVVASNLPGGASEVGAPRGVAPPKLPGGASEVVAPQKLPVGASEGVAPRVPRGVARPSSFEEEKAQLKAQIERIKFENAQLRAQMTLRNVEIDCIKAYCDSADNQAEVWRKQAAFYKELSNDFRKSLSRTQADLAQRESDLSHAETGFYRVMDALLKEREEVAKLKALLSGVNCPK
jgi:hypothetical protein